MALTPSEEKLVAASLTPHFLGDQQKALVALASTTVEAAELAVQDTVDGLQEQLNDLKSTEGAGLVGIEDVAGSFTATDVEGALAELVIMASPFDPSDSYTITGEWEFTQDLELASLTAASGVITSLVSDAVSVAGLSLVEGSDAISFSFSLTDDRTYTLQDASGTLAFLSDIPAQVNLTAGSNVNITGSYPNLTISATGGGGGGGDVTSVNGQIGDVVLDNEDVGAAAAVHTHSNATTSVAGFMSGADKLKLNGIATGATANTGTVTSVNVTNSGTGISFTGGPVVGSGTITASLSSNLQAWSAVAPASKANASDVVTTSGNQTGLSGNKTWTGDHTFGNVSDAGGNVRRPQAAVVGSSGNFTADQLNGIVEKVGAASLTWTIPPGLGSHGDVLTVSNQSSSGNIIISRGSGVSLYRNGTDANITVTPGSSVTIFRTSISNRWSG